MSRSCHYFDAGQINTSLGHRNSENSQKKNEINPKILKRTHCASPDHRTQGICNNDRDVLKLKREVVNHWKQSKQLEIAGGNKAISSSVFDA